MRVNSSFSLSIDVVEKLNDYCEQNACMKSKVVEKCIREYLKREENSND